MPVGNESVRVSLTPASGLLGFGIRGDTLDYDRLMAAEYQDDLAVPELEDLGDEQFSFAFSPTIPTEGAS